MQPKNLDIVTRNGQFLTFVFEKESYTINLNTLDKAQILEEFGVDYNWKVDNLQELFNHVLDIEDYVYSILLDNKTLWFKSRPTKTFQEAYTAFLGGKAIQSLVNPNTFRLSKCKTHLFLKGTLDDREKRFESLQEKFISFEMMLNDWYIID